jgi:hypothetical protein
VRLTFKDEQVYNLLGLETDGVGIWIAFKVVLIMPLSAFYAWYLTRIMQRYRIPDRKPVVLLTTSAPAAKPSAIRAANGPDPDPSPDGGGKPAPREPREAELG